MFYAETDCKVPTLHSRYSNEGSTDNTMVAIARSFLPRYLAYLSAPLVVSHAQSTSYTGPSMLDNYDFVYIGTHKPLYSGHLFLSRCKYLFVVFNPEIRTPLVWYNAVIARITVY